MISRQQHKYSVAFSGGLSCYVFIVGTCRCRFFSVTLLTFLSCRRPFFLLFRRSFRASFHSLHKLLNPPSTPYSFHYSPHLSFPLPFCPPTVSDVFFTLFPQRHHHFSLSSSSISFSTPRCLLSSPVFVSLLPTTS